MGKHFGDQMEQRFLANFQCPPPLTCPYCPHTTVRQTGQPLENHKNQLLYHLGSIHKVVEEMLGSTYDSPASSPAPPSTPSKCRVCQLFFPGRPAMLQHCVDSHFKGILESKFLKEISTN